MKKIKTFLVWLLLATALLMPVQASAATCASIQSVQLYNARYCPLDALEQCGLEIVEQTNERIDEIIRESQHLAKKARNQCEVDAIIIAMLVRTTAVSIAGQIAARLCGVETVCDFVDVQVGNRTVAVDPLRVVSV